MGSVERQVLLPPFLKMKQELQHAPGRLVRRLRGSRPLLHPRVTAPGGDWVGRKLQTRDVCDAAACPGTEVGTTCL